MKNIKPGLIKPCIVIPFVPAWFLLLFMKYKALKKYFIKNLRNRKVSHKFVTNWLQIIQ